MTTYTVSLDYTFSSTQPPADPPVPMWLSRVVVLDEAWEADDPYCASLRRDLEADAWRAEA